MCASLTWPSCPLHEYRRRALLQGSGEIVAISIADGKRLWATKLAQMPLGGATVANDLVFTTTLTGELVALSRKDGQGVCARRSWRRGDDQCDRGDGVLTVGAQARLAQTPRTHHADTTDTPRPCC